MSDCSTNWKLPKKYPAEVVRIGDKYGIRIRGKRALVVDRECASYILADLMVLLRERERL